VAVEGAGGRKLAELVADHVLGHQHRQKLVAVVDAEREPDELRQDGRPDLVEKKRGGLVLGFDPDAIYEEDVIQLTPGEGLVIYTDGVSEAMIAVGTSAVTGSGLNFFPG